MKKLLENAAAALGALLFGVFRLYSDRRVQDAAETFSARLVGRPLPRPVVVRQCVPTRHAMVRRRRGAGTA
ncbi:hypothetical protein AB0H00_29850 [Nocardia sp. NPDC023852]|uniref:hypothetical protein n=1 Tax=Nocardia sp. NPDC023852 TaxID=3154697 RepID=UPI0033DD20F3